MIYISSLTSGSWPWYTARGTGFAGLALLVGLMIGGIGHATGLTYKFIEPVKAWAIHKAMGVMLLVAVALHMLALFFDSFVSFSVVNIIVPFTSSYSNGSTLIRISLSYFAVASGVMAMYGIAIIVASSLGWIDTNKGIWRKLHYLSYAVLPLVLVHALGTGSDLKEGEGARTLMIILLLAMVVAIVSRLVRTSGKSREAKIGN
jgi:DMSO/TMAO reductase YedYZ heme-binding membrane subunit